LALQDVLQRALVSSSETDKGAVGNEAKSAVDTWAFPTLQLSHLGIVHDSTATEALLNEVISY
jgi:hypothetical protein